MGTLSETYNMKWFLNEKIIRTSIGFDYKMLSQ